jgi:antitoxin component YwqK of YwqJK toxin-antitoxin module
MKNHIIISLLFLLIGCSKESVELSKLQDRGGLYYKINSEEPYSGTSFELYENGQKKSEGTYKDGKEDGLHTSWYNNGQKHIEETYKDGKQDGLYTKWYENGQKKSEMTYKNNMMVNIIGRWNSDGSVKK